jgi:hypothetical protein
MTYASIEMQLDRNASGFWNSPYTVTPIINLKLILSA